MSGAHLTSARGCITELRRGPVTEAPGSHLKERGLQLRAEDTSRPRSPTFLWPHRSPWEQAGCVFC